MRAMHELPLASEVLKVTGKEAEINNAGSVNKITIDAGNMTGFEISTFRSAPELLSDDSGRRIFAL